MSRRSRPFTLPALTPAQLRETGRVLAEHALGHGDPAVVDLYGTRILVTRGPVRREPGCTCAIVTPETFGKLFALPRNRIPEAVEAVRQHGEGVLE